MDTLGRTVGSLRGISPKKRKGNKTMKNGKALSMLQAEADLVADALPDGKGYRLRWDVPEDRDTARTSFGGWTFGIGTRDGGNGCETVIRLPERFPVEFNKLAVKDNPEFISAFLADSEKAFGDDEANPVRFALPMTTNGPDRSIYSVLSVVDFDGKKGDSDTGETAASRLAYHAEIVNKTSRVKECRERFISRSLDRAEELGRAVCPALFMKLRVASEIAFPTC